LLKKQSYDLERSFISIKFLGFFALKICQMFLFFATVYL